MLNILIIAMMVSMGAHTPMMKNVKVMWMEMGINALVEDATLQKELGLTEEQIEKFKEIMRKRAKRVMRNRIKNKRMK